MQTGVEDTRCYLCDSRESEPWATERGWTVVKCRPCGVVYVNPRPAADSISEAARTGLHETERGTFDAIGLYSAPKMRDYRAKLAEVYPALGSAPSRWLDIGAGFGEFVEALGALAAPGSHVRGVEPCVPKVDRARARGLPVSSEPLSAIHERFTHLSLINVYSHLPQPIEFLASLRERLSPGGELLVVTGNAGDLDRSDVPGALYVPDHLSFAGEAALKRVLERAGYELIAVHPYRAEVSHDHPLLTFAKNLVRVPLGKPWVPLWSPASSRLRSLWVRARLR